MTLQRQRMFIHEMGVTLQNFAVITFIKALTHTGLLINNGISVVQDIGK